MNRLHRQMRDDLNAKLNEVIDTTAKEKGVQRQEVLKMVKEFLRTPQPQKQK